MSSPFYLPPQRINRALVHADDLADFVPTAAAPTPQPAPQQASTPSAAAFNAAVAQLGASARASVPGLTLMGEQPKA